MHITAVLILLMSVLACSPRQGREANAGPPSHGIVGGSSVPDSSPIAHHVVAVHGADGNGGYLCTAVLITHDAVLTAAHCASELRQGEIIFATDLSHAPPSQRRSVTSVMVHRRFTETLGRLEARGDRPANTIRNWGDLAVMRFSGTLPNGYKPIEIAGEEILHDGSPVIVAGYGLVDGEKRIPTNRLHEASVQVKKAHYSASEFTLEGREGQGACHGDSGGPAFVIEGRSPLLVGITSRGFDEDCKKASIYTRAASFINWISRAVN